MPAYSFTQAAEFDLDSFRAGACWMVWILLDRTIRLLGVDRVDHLSRPGVAGHPARRCALREGAVTVGVWGMSQPGIGVSWRRWWAAMP